MFGDVVHGYEHESIEAKAAWFATLTIEERLHLLSVMYGLAVALNPSLRRGTDDAGPPGATVQFIELPAD
jgi:hypothetical protein